MLTPLPHGLCISGHTDAMRAIPGRVPGRRCVNETRLQAVVVLLDEGGDAIYAGRASLSRPTKYAAIAAVTYPNTANA